MHGAHLLVEGKKMSKSLGNYFVLRDLTAKGYTGREIRCLLLNAHYRETFNFTIGGLDGVRTSLGRLDECLGKLRGLAGNAQAQAEPTMVADFSAALDDDLNVAGAWGVIFEWVREKNRQPKDGAVSPVQAAAKPFRRGGRWTRCWVWAKLLKRKHPRNWLTSWRKGRRRGKRRISSEPTRSEKN